jgi:hypothetical protein
MTFAYPSGFRRVLFVPHPQAMNQPGWVVEEVVPHPIPAGIYCAGWPWRSGRQFMPADDPDERTEAGRMQTSDVDRPQTPSERKRPRVQFGLSFLFLLITTSAVCCALIRGVEQSIVRPPARYVAYAYLLLLTAYMALRVPVVLGRVSFEASAPLRPSVDELRRGSHIGDPHNVTAGATMKGIRELAPTHARSASEGHRNSPRAQPPSVSHCTSARHLSRRGVRGAIR